MKYRGSRTGWGHLNKTPEPPGRERAGKGNKNTETKMKMY